MSNCEFQSNCGFAKLLAEKRNQRLEDVSCGRESFMETCPRNPKNPNTWIKIDEKQLTGDYELKVVYPSSRRTQQIVSQFEDSFLI